MERRQPFAAIDLALLLMIVLWAANISIIKASLSQLAPMAFNALRFGAASLITLFLTRGIEHDVSIPRKSWGWVAILGFVGHFCYQALFINGLARTTASNSALLLSTAPIFVALISTANGSERLAGWNWLGILLSFAGIGLLITGSGSRITLASKTLAGDLMTLSAAMCWAVNTSYSRRLIQQTSALRTTTWTMLVATPLMALAALPELRAQDWRAVTASAWMGLAYSSIFAIALGYVIWNTGVQRLGGARTSTYQYLTPLISVVLAWTFLGENLRPLQVIGAVGILAGVALGRYRRLR